MVAEVGAAAKAGDSVGGVAEVVAYGVPVGLGSHVHWDRRLDAMLAQALMSINAVKAVEIGEGRGVAGRRGSEAHDAISWDAEAHEYRRETARAGGIEGGMSTGGVIVARAAMKPLATLNRPVLKTVDVTTKEETVSFKERTDVTAVPAMAVVAEQKAGRAEASRPRGPGVVSVAGGGVLAPDNRAALRRWGTVVWRGAGGDPLAQGGGSGAGRPLLGDAPPAALARLDAERRGL